MAECILILKQLFLSLRSLVFKKLLKDIGHSLKPQLKKDCQANIDNPTSCPLQADISKFNPPFLKNKDLFFFPKYILKNSKGKFALSILFNFFLPTHTQRKGEVYMKCCV